MIFLIIVPCVLCFVYAWRRRQKYLEGKLPPIGVGAWPVIGHMHLWMTGRLWNRLLEIQQDCLNKGGVTYLHSGTNPSYTYYALSCPEDCASLTNTNHQKAFLLDDSIKEFFGEGLTSASVSVWENHRQLLEPIFEQLSGCSGVTNRQSRILVEEFGREIGKGLFDSRAYLRQTTFKVLFSTIFGATIDTNIQHERIELYKNALEEISDILTARYKSFYLHNKILYYCSRLKRKQRNCTGAIKDITNAIIASRKAEIIYESTTAGNNVNDIRVQDASPSLLDALLQLQAQDLYSEQQVVDELTSAMFGGYSTIVNSLTYNLVLLGSHPAIQENVFLEIHNTINNKYDVDIVDAAKFVYLEAVILEGLRLYPPVTTISRTIASSTEINKYTIDPGTNCLLFIFAMNRHRCWGADGEAFRPERWLNRSSLPSQACASFGLGKRSCIGMKLALNAMKIILVHLLREYKIIADVTKLVVSQELMLTPVSGHQIALEKRMKHGFKNVLK